MRLPLAYTVASPLVTVAGALTTFAAPILLPPDRFVQFLLLMSVFQYIGDFDLGLSRLADRRLSAATDANALIWARWSIGAVIAVLVSVSACIVGVLPATAGLAGVAFMVANGPVTVYRARSQVARFTATALLMQLGLSGPRFLGLILAGVSGCVLSLAGWYLLICIALNAAFVRRPPPVAEIIHTVRDALPMFAFGTLWLLYVLSSRWVAWALSSPHDAGLLAFGANFITIGLGIIGTVAQVHYPRHLARPVSRHLYQELLVLTAVASIGTVVGDGLCLYALAWVFPHYLEAVPVVGPLLLTAVPLSLSTWLVPMVIAKSDRPWRQALGLFGSAIVGLAVCMTIGAGCGGIVGQAWAVVPSSLVVIASLLWLIAHCGLLQAGHALRLGGLIAVTTLTLAGLWLVII